ncbi:MAG TPA: hypothetical protein VGH42_05650 [Verrucomicrobiae bacterium]|jgi:uncharacterized protein YggT (Ycf19 family)
MFNDFVSFIDFILNLAGLLLWINWRSTLFDPFEKRTPATLVGALRRAAPTRFRHWHLLAAIIALLVLRALFYWQIGSETGWSGKLDLGVTTIFFRSNFFGQMFLFSIFSFARILGIIYLWLMLLSILDGPMPTHHFVKMQLGTIDSWPRWIKFLLPLAATALFWELASWPFAWLHPKPAMSAAHRVEEALVIGLGSYLVWKFAIAALLALHLLGSYIYFGKNPFWKYVNATAQELLKPLEKIPLRLGKADFAPVVGIALVFLFAELAGRGLVWLYARLPL